jgi:hypothetical protein
LKSDRFTITSLIIVFSNHSVGLYSPLAPHNKEKKQ